MECACGETDPKKFWKKQGGGTKRSCITCCLLDSRDPDAKRFGLARQNRAMESKCFPVTKASLLAVE